MDSRIKLSEIRTTLIDNGIDPDVLVEFLEEQVSMSRCTDDAMRNTIGKTEFYRRETKYTKIESFIVHLK